MPRSCGAESSLGKRVALGRQVVQNVSERRTLSDFVARYRRWGVLQRQAAGPLVYACGALLNPVLLAAAAAVVTWLVTFAGSCLAGLPLLIREGLSMGDLRRLARAEARAERAGSHVSLPNGGRMVPGRGPQGGDGAR